MIALTPDALAAAQLKSTSFDLNGAPPANTDPAALKKAAQQFEALLIQQMLKEMRNSSLDEGGMFSSNQMNGYQQMFDREIAVKMAEGQGFGLASRMIEQIRVQQADQSSDAKSVSGGALPVSADAPVNLPIDRSRFIDTGLGQVRRPSLPVLEATSRTASAEIASANPAGKPGPREAAFQSREDFITTLMPLARRAASQLGVPAEAIVAQAALETGWGQHMITAEDGRPGWNLFGIKAGSSWDGESVSARTLELRDGQLQPERARFRVYESPSEAVQDYVDFLSGSSRYETALAEGRDTGTFAHGLQQAGYATDPDYAEKIQRVAASLPGVTDA